MTDEARAQVLDELANPKVSAEDRKMIGLVTSVVVHAAHEVLDAVDLSPEQAINVFLNAAAAEIAEYLIELRENGDPTPDTRKFGVALEELIDLHTGGLMAKRGR